MKLNKKNILSLALLLCAGNGALAQEGGRDHLPQIPDSFAQVVDAVNAIEGNNAYLHQLAFEIKKFIEDVDKTLNKLKDPKDNTSFGQCVAFVDEKLHVMLGSFINPLKIKLAEENDRTSAYYKALQAADDILTNFYAQFQKVAKVMKIAENKKTGAKMALALKEQIDLFFKQHDAVDRKLAELLKCLEQLQLDTLVKEMASIRVLFQQAKAENAQPLSLANQAKIANILHKKIHQR